MTYNFVNIPGLQTQGQAAIKAMLDQIDAGTAAGEQLTLPATPDYTATVTTTDDTKIWKGINVPGWGRVWFLTSTATSSNIDTSGVLDDAAIPGSELDNGDFFFAKTSTSGTVAAGFFILKSFTDGTPATNINASNISSLGLADSD